MSNNIRGLNDVRNNNNNNGNFGNNLRNMNFFTTGNDGPQKDPLKETFWDMLHINICPQLVFFSFSVLAVIFFFIFFFIQIFVDGISKDAQKITTELLPVNIENPNGISNYLLLYKDDIKNKYQIYRLATALIIHADFTHVLFNSLMMIIWTSYFEIFLTSKKMIILFLLSGIIGNTFAVVVQPEVKSLGASTAIFGIIGCALGYLIFNWNNLDYEGSPRFMWTCQVVFITIMSFLFTSSGVNNWAHLGGFLAGVLIGLFMCERHQKPGGQTADLSTHEKTWKIVGMSGTFFFFTLCFCLLMFAQ